MKACPATKGRPIPPELPYAGAVKQGLYSWWYTRPDFGSQVSCGRPVTIPAFVPKKVAWPTPRVEVDSDRVLPGFAALKAVIEAGSYWMLMLGNDCVPFCHKVTPEIVHPLTAPSTMRLPWKMFGSR